MQAQVTWTVKSIQHYPDAQPNAPGEYCLIEWDLSITDDKYSVNTYGTTAVTFKEAGYTPPVAEEGQPTPVEPFMADWLPFASLSNETCATWIRGAMGEIAVQMNVDALVKQLDALENPPATPVVPPWATEALVKPL